jgi:hypothetical protein
MMSVENRKSNVNFNHLLSYITQLIDQSNATTELALS